MVIDSRLKAIYDGKTETDAEQRLLMEQFIASLGPGGARDLLDGAYTLVYMYVTWLRKAYEEHEKDVVEYVVPDLVATMSTMRRSVRPETIPTMAGLVIAACIGLSPNLWREQFGEGTKGELNALEVTALLLAEHINRLTGDRDCATRLITNALSTATQD